MQLEDWLDDLCVRFIINLPPEELESVERICFQVEEAQWFYEDFIRPLDPSLPSLSLKAFSLRIFQHCPLFSTWSMHHYTSAFAEFLAYKQRVPVRGAIMLNEEMDEVVLVKGWKKGANWSFPRGKINKDENDLDCAIREVYEETGYDIQSAGLVKPEKEMKYIEVTMREQHMRLYVFRGVPKDTHFEPKTRKEISKIEWYKLTDLPTLKKKQPHHDGADENPALNANKFYMVAPFLHPLKKWIAQQKKKESRYSSSHLAAPPLTVDDSATEGEPGPTAYPNYLTTTLSPQIPSSLPEVATSQYQHPSQDPSSHLKELLRIGRAPSAVESNAQHVHVSNADTAKSNALLSLLRNGSTAEMRATPHTPSERTSFQQPVLDSRQPEQPVANTSVEGYERTLPPPANPSPLRTQQRSLLDLFAKAGTSDQQPQNQPSTVPHDAAQVPQQPTQQPLAPYQRTGDPQFSRDSPEETRAQVVPPAHALPKLTQHTRALLDAFKVHPPSSEHVSPLVQNPNQVQLAPNKQALLDVFKATNPFAPHNTQSNQPPSSTILPPIDRVRTAQQGQQFNQPQAKSNIGSSNAASLLGLFKNYDEISAAKPKLEEPMLAPVELAAGPMASPKPEAAVSQSELLSLLSRKDAPKRTPQATRAGETAATIDGPLNQPHFDSIAKSPSQLSVDSMRRSPVPAHRTLFDHKQPTPTKILQRVEESKRTSGKSPRAPKAQLAVASPKQKSRPKPDKPFQPQILKRPQNMDDQEKKTISPIVANSSENLRKEAQSPLPPPVTTSPVPMTLPNHSPQPQSVGGFQQTPQTESQKQNLLSLLTGTPSTLNIAKATQQTPTPGTISPLTQSQIVSPLGEEPPISTRSRMGSLVSVTSAVGNSDIRAKPEKRQTAASDKAFLLGYLGRIANQEGQM